MPRKILVVDDEPDICQIIQHALNGQGYQTFAAYDGLAGKQAIEKLHPDLVILDLKMPKLNGYELTLLLKQDRRYADLPIIIMTSLTAESTKSDEEWRASLGVSDFLSKPFETEELLTRVAAVLGEKAPEELSGK